jgi:hypothetical protein
LPPWLIVNLVSSALATTLVGWYVCVRARALRGDALDDGDRLVAVALAVLAANALMSFAYTKDVILSPAGVFYAIAVYVSGRALLLRSARSGRVVVQAAVLTLAVVGATAWAIRDAGLHLNLRQWAFRERNEWAHAGDWLAGQQITPATVSQRALVATLQADALSRPVPEPLYGGWIEWFDLN